MAAPKKKTSKARGRRRYANWLNQANLQAQRAMSIGRSILTKRATGFYYPGADEESEED